MDEWRYRIYEFLNVRRKSVIGRWLEDERLSSRDRGALRAKTDMLARVEPELIGAVLAGPIKSKTDPRGPKHVYKMVIHADRMLRPMLCKGPIDNDGEFTFLLGALEIGDKEDHDAAEAERNRQIVIADQSRRERNGRYR
jgi:hypothetical protein